MIVSMNMSMESQAPTLQRANGVLDLAGASFVGSLVTTLAALVFVYQALPPNDGAYGSGLLFFVNLYVILIAGMGAAMGWLVAFLGSLLLMRRVPLMDGSLIVIASVLLTMALLAPLIGYLIIVPAFVVMLISMVLCRFWIRLVPYDGTNVFFPKNFMRVVKASLLVLFLVSLGRAFASDVDMDLLRAARGDDFARVEGALNAGADPNFRGPQKDTPLMKASSNNQADIARLLVERGASIELTSRLDRTPIMWAAQSGNFALVRFYLDQGANLSVRDRMGQDASDIARDAGQAQLAELLKPPSAPRQ